MLPRATHDPLAPRDTGVVIGTAPDASQSRDGCIAASDQVPIVTDGEAIDDAACFDEHPGRRYRVRDNWVIRRSRWNVFLRTLLPPQHHSVDTEASAEAAWWAAAYPFLAPAARKRAAKAARGGSSANKEKR